jgi:hypothetical protein
MNIKEITTMNRQPGYYLEKSSFGLEDEIIYKHILFRFTHGETEARFQCSFRENDLPETVDFFENLFPGKVTGN